MAKPTPLLQSMDRWSHVLRHHRADQLARRLLYRVRDRFFPLEGCPDGSRPRLRHSLPVFDRHTTFPKKVPSRFSASELELLNRIYAVDKLDDWITPFDNTTPLLALFHLHYHEYLLDAPPQDTWHTVRSWLHQFATPQKSRMHQIAWHPYCISRRIPVWMSLLCREPPAELGVEMMSSLAHQARCLARRFERDLGGNHLWDNARALALAGCFFDGDEADGWLRVGWSTLEQCLDAQLLPWGEHEERSPMYQADLADGLLCLAQWVQPINEAMARECKRRSECMHGFLDSIRHPDGNLPMFGDTTLDSDQSVRPSGFVSGWSGEYFVHRREMGHFLIFDTGNVGPDHLPAHAHSDLLGCEISAFGWRLLVDSGVFEYAGDRRASYRASAAHNVLTIDHRQHADAWGSFRMGRRGHVTNRGTGRANDVFWAWAEHDAYRSMRVRVRRYFVLLPTGSMLSIHVALGSGSRQLSEYLHWHRNISWHQTSEGFHTDLGSGVVRFFNATPQAELIPSRGMQSERFSIEREHDIWCLEQRTALPAISAWMICVDGSDASPEVAMNGSSMIATWKNWDTEQRIEIPILDT